MIFLILLAIAVIIFLLSLRKNSARLNESGKMWAEQKLFWKLTIVPVLLIGFAIINPFRIERVDAGHVGVKVNLTGDKRGVSDYEYRTGWVLYNNWFSTLYEFPTYQQHIDYDSQTVITKGGFPATIKPSFNYSLKPGDVGDMFQNLRMGIKQVEQEWLHTAIVGSVNDVANRWTVDSIFNNRERFENDILAETNKRTVKWFNISQLRTNIVPPPALVDAISKKTQAIQDVQVANNQKLVAEALMQKKIAEAKGDSSKIVIGASADAQAAREQAAGEADAIRLKQTQLTPEYLDYLKLSKWNGALPQVTSGSSGILLNLKGQ